MSTHHSIQAHVRCAVLLRTAKRMVLPFAGFLLLTPPVVRGDDFWKHKPASEWTRAEALKLLRRSPWAKQEIVPLVRREDQASFSIPTGTRHCDPDAIDQNGNCMQKGRIEAPVDSSRQVDAAPQIRPSVGILVRWESAGPVAQAFARLEQLGEHAAGAFQAPPPRRPPDRYVITVKLENPGRAGFEPFAVTPSGKPALLATLKTSRGAVSPLQIEFTGVGAESAAHLFFPRTIHATPLLTGAHDSVEFTLRGSGFTVHSKFALDLESLD